MSSLVYMRRGCLFLSVFVGIFAILFLSTSVAALNANFTNITGGIERASSESSSANLINFTIGAMSENITNVQFVITGSTNIDPDKFIVNSNGSSASHSFNVSNFTNYSMYGSSFVLMINFTNMGPLSLIPNGTTKNFWFNINSKSRSSSNLAITVDATGKSGTVNSTVPLSWPFTFRFSGYVKNETGSFQNGTNVSLYRFDEGAPPTETLISNVLTGMDGNFTMSGIDASGSKKYTLKMVLYNSSNPEQAIKIGTILPQFPAEMFYPTLIEEEKSRLEFMRPPSLNGTIFYLGPAATINVSANNQSRAQMFGYMLMEQGTGFSIASNAATNVTNVKLVVPIGRTYTLMLIRAKAQFVQGAICNGRSMNDTSCASPPKSNSTLNPTIAGETINVDMDLRTSRLQVMGCIGVVGNTSSITNITGIYPKMTPWTGFVPPMRPDVQDINLVNQSILNHSDPKCPGKIAWYNISLLNNNYLIEFYGRNNTAGTTGQYMGAFQNASLSDGNNKNINITLVQLAGAFVEATAGEINSGTGTNITKFIINVQNSSGGAITSDKPGINLLVKNSVFGEMTYMVDDVTNGTFKLSLPLNSTVKIKIFSNNAPPKEKVVNLSVSQINITLTTMSSGDAGFKKINASGGMEMMNITESNFGVNMRFIRSTSECNVVSPADACVLSNTTGRGFNPFTAMVAGRINMEMKMSSSNVTMTFYNFDMFSAKQPPMESVMNNQATSGNGSAAQVWQFGSFVPAEVYDYAIVAMPYTDATINDSKDIRMNIPYLYDENWAILWNATRGDTTTNITSDIDDYLGNVNNRSFNSTGYREFLSASGLACNKTNNNIAIASPEVYCYANTSANMIYMRIPHFSGIAPGISGTAPSTAAVVADTTADSTGGSTAAEFWSKTYIENDKPLDQKGIINKILGTSERIKFKIGTVDHSAGVVKISSGKVTINVSSTPQQAIFGVGDSNKFDVTNDDYYDVQVTLNSINTTGTTRANVSLVYINEKKVASTPTSNNSTNSNITQNSTGTFVDNSKEAVKKMKTFYITILIVVVVIVLAVVGILIYIIFKRKKKWN